MAGLMNPGGEPGASPAPGLEQPQGDTAPPPPVPMTDMHDQLEMMQAQYSQLMSIRGLLDKIRVELTSLQKLGDLVTSEDVVRGAGNLVAAGANPADMAALLSSMPEGGQALQQWISGNAEMVGQKEGELDGPLQMMRHELGVAALRTLAADHLGNPPSASSPPLPVNTRPQVLGGLIGPENSVGAGERGSALLAPIGGSR